MMFILVCQVKFCLSVVSHLYCSRSCMAWCSCGCLLMWHFKLFMLVVAKSQLQHLSNTEKRWSETFLIDHKLKLAGRWAQSRQVWKNNYNILCFHITHGWKFVQTPLTWCVYMGCPKHAHILSLQEGRETWWFTSLQTLVSWLLPSTSAGTGSLIAFDDTNRWKWDRCSFLWGC